MFLESLRTLDDPQLEKCSIKKEEKSMENNNCRNMSSQTVNGSGGILTAIVEEISSQFKTKVL